MSQSAGQASSVGSAPIASGPIIDADGHAFARVDFDKLSRKSERLTAIAKKHPDAFAGVVFSEETGRLSVRVKSGTPGAASTRAAIAGELVDSVAPIDVVDVSYSLADLEARAAKLKSNTEWAGKNASSVAHISVDELHARVRVDVVDDVLTEVRDAAEKVSGGSVFVKRVTAPPTPQGRRSDLQPFEGSLPIWSAVQPFPATSSAGCTVAFKMTKGTAYYQATAGHCGSVGSTRWYRGTAATYKFSTDYESVGIDAALMAPVASQLFSSYMFFGESWDELNQDPVTAKNTAAPPLGSALYISGANSGVVYGLVTDTSDFCGAISYTVVDTEIHGEGWSYTLPGDSGAPVTRWNTSTTLADDHVAVGIHGCGNGVDRSWITAINRVESVSGASVLLATP